MPCETCKSIVEIECGGFTTQDLYLGAVALIEKLEANGKLKFESQNIESVVTCKKCNQRWSICMPDGPMRGWLRPVPKNQDRMDELHEKYRRK